MLEDVAPILPSEKTHKFKMSGAYKEALSIYYGLKQKGERSERALTLTSVLISHNPSSYDFWICRKEILEDLWARMGSTDRAQYERSFARECAWVKEEIAAAVKNYQTWQHLLWLAQKRDLGVFEDGAMSAIGEEDEKNIHFWGFLVKYADLYGRHRRALDFSTPYIERDVRNNSAWAFRHAMLARLSKDLGEREAAELLGEERSFLLRHALLRNNLSFWHYISSMRIIFPSADILGDIMGECEKSVAGKQRPAYQEE